jgi:L-threonylcarbamoyladenylate synthase
MAAMHNRPDIPSDILAPAVNTLRQGGLCIYPTETFYALGCDACNPVAVARLLGMKNRPQTQGVPVLIGHAEQLGLAVDMATMQAMDKTRREALFLLQERFWPGPLSLLLPAGARLSPGVAGDNKLVALRVSPHPLARSLCLELDAPLVATSANQRGGPPAVHEQELDPQLMRRVGCLAPLPSGNPSPAGGLPSTLALVEGTSHGARVSILRQGAVPAAAIAALGLMVHCPDGTKI